MSSTFSRLIQEVAINLQQPLLEPVEDACKISWDTIDMHIYYDNKDDQTRIVIASEIAKIGDIADNVIFKLLLQANYLWVASENATLSLNPENEYLALCDKIDIKVTNSQSLTQRIRELYKTAIYWQEVISNRQYTKTANELFATNQKYQSLLIKV